MTPEEVDEYAKADLEATILERDLASEAVVRWTNRAEIAEEKLAKIATIYETVTPLPDGLKGSISTHARYNLEGALIDLKRLGTADEACINTIEMVIKQLGDIEQVLEEK